MEDSDSVDAWSAGLSAQTKIIAPDQLKEFRMRFAAGGGGNILLGTATAIADQLQALSEAGLDGVLCTWVDVADGLERFARGVLPELERRGLRQPFDFDDAAR
jgi:alkanesulfonate monooxygenase SsuD/methylene tetrahydromethanopterin reductase-like flavin-dependent oxidoreductase (luciferase family)